MKSEKFESELIEFKNLLVYLGQLEMNIINNKRNLLVMNKDKISTIERLNDLDEIIRNDQTDISNPD